MPVYRDMVEDVAYAKRNFLLLLEEVELEVPGGKPTLAQTSELDQICVNTGMSFSFVFHSGRASWRPE